VTDTISPSAAARTKAGRQKAAEWLKYLKWKELKVEDLRP